MELDDIHRCHRQARTVDHAANRAIEFDVVELVLRGFELHRVFFVLVAQLFDIRMPIERVVVEVHLCVERDHIACAGDDQRVDLHKRGIHVEKGLVHGHQELGSALDLRTLKAEPEGDLAGVERHDAGRRVNRDGCDLFRGFFGNGFNVHAAFGRGDDNDAGGFAVDQQAEVKLARDVATFLDIDAFDLFAFCAGLLGDEDIAQHGFGMCAHIVIRTGEANTAAAVRIVGEVPGTAAACMNLGFDDPDVTTEFGGSLAGLVNCVGDRTAWDGHTEFRQQTFGLIFVDVHERIGPEDCCPQGP